jgi:hypothetical protein
MGDKKEGGYLTNASVAELGATDVTRHTVQNWYFDENLMKMA